MKKNPCFSDFAWRLQQQKNWKKRRKNIIRNWLNISSFEKCASVVAKWRRVENLPKHNHLIRSQGIKYTKASQGPKSTKASQRHQWRSEFLNFALNSILENRFCIYFVSILFYSIANPTKMCFPNTSKERNFFKRPLWKWATTVYHTSWIMNSRQQTKFT